MTRKRVPRERANERVWELAYRRAVNDIGPDNFVRFVNIVDMVPAQYAPYPSEGYIPGTFDIIREMLGDKVISEDEYRAIALDMSLETFICPNCSHSKSSHRMIENWFGNRTNVIACVQSMGLGDPCGCEKYNLD